MAGGGNEFWFFFTCDISLPLAFSLLHAGLLWLRAYLLARSCRRSFIIIRCPAHDCQYDAAAFLLASSRGAIPLKHLACKIAAVGVQVMDVMERTHSILPAVQGCFILRYGCHLNLLLVHDKIIKGIANSEKEKEESQG